MLERLRHVRGSQPEVAFFRFGSFPNDGSAQIRDRVRDGLPMHTPRSATSIALVVQNNTVLASSGNRACFGGTRAPP